MQQPTSSGSAPSAEVGSSPRKSWQEAALTSTPIVLTVLATALAGLSSSEMTLAQYHRSLAAQNQSKASDQWAFFQAKRMRETSMELAADLVPVLFKSGKANPESLKIAVTHLIDGLQQGEREGGRLIQGLDSARTLSPRPLPGGGGAGGEGAERIRQAAEELQKTAKDAADKAGKLKLQLDQELERGDVRQAFAYLTGDALPEVQDTPLAFPEIDQAVHAITDRIPEAEMMAFLRNIKDSDLSQAIDAAEANARRFENAGKPVSKTLDDIGKLVNRLVAQAASFHQALRALNAAVAKVSTEASGAGDLQKALAQGEHVDKAIQAAAEELNDLFKAGRYDFNSRRLGREASYNLKTAGLYEVQVRLNSLDSARHRTRSKLFFFGMLAAQAGVTIASLSLAVRQRNILWGLAGLAGIGAVLFSGYVYLYM